MSRFLKQFIYGTLFLAVIGVIVYGVYFLALRPTPSCFDNRQNGDETGIDCGGSCISCEIKNLQILNISATSLFGTDRVFSASAEVSNPNHNFGAKSFDYEVNFYDTAGNPLVAPIKNKSFVYAGESKRIVEAGVRITTGIPRSAEIKIVTSSITWERAEEFFEPPHELGNLSAAAEGSQLVVSGNFTNLNNYIISRVIVTAFAIDSSGNRVGASRTELQNVGPFRVENFKVFIPLSATVLESVDFARTGNSVFVEVLK
jgi:hypothetical protein